jgi:hypothetical protein
LDIHAVCDPKFHPKKDTSKKFKDLWNNLYLWWTRHRFYLSSEVFMNDLITKYPVNEAFQKFKTIKGILNYQQKS